mmetsp:Transcript_1422/g.5935  ORF Transcript_1422/g.5935 Transcript_1422/m.5935 type:complete len:200 (+) Transcript_1422:1069-1668(+)
MSSTKNAFASLRARRRARRVSGKPGSALAAIRDVFGKGATERAHVSATSARCALSDAAPSAAESVRAPRVHATIVAQVNNSVIAVRTTPAACARSENVSPGANGPAVRTARIQLGFPDPSRTGALSSVLAALAVVAAPRDAARVARWVSPVRASAVSRHGERSNFGERRAREAVVPSSNALVITRPRRLKPPASRRASR